MRDGALTDAKIAALKPEPGKRLPAHDGCGLWLISANTKAGDDVARHWAFKFWLNGRQREMGLGRYPLIGIKEARALRTEAAALVVRGIDPIEERNARKQSRQERPESKSFRLAADDWIKNQERQGRWKHEDYGSQVAQSLVTHVFLAKVGGRLFGELRCDEIDIAAVRAVLDPLWCRGGIPQTASKIRGRIESILDYAVLNGWRNGAANPARWKGGLASQYGLVSDLAETKNHEAVRPADAARFIMALRKVEGVEARALEFVALTAVRTASILLARWNDVNLDTRTWHVPKTKTDVEAWIPLTDEMFAALSGVDPNFPTHSNALIFPISRNDMYRLCKRLAGKLDLASVTVHGWRATFKTWGSTTGQDTFLVEAALSHALGNAVTRAYDRAELHHNLLELRRPLMERWCQFLNTEYRAKATVIPFRPAALAVAS